VTALLHGFAKYVPIHLARPSMDKHQEHANQSGLANAAPVMLRNLFRG
jgi:hypothetical protein